MNKSTWSHLAVPLVILLTASGVWAQSKWHVPEEMWAYPSFIKVPVFPRDLVQNPALPRVLVIGDSISMYYTAEVRHLLTGRACIYRIPDNGSSTEYGLKNLDYWLGDGNWSVIHFNFGLHDLAIASAVGKAHVSSTDYEKNLSEIVRRLQATGAKLIWASTTPVPVGAHGRSEADVVTYNRIAKRIMDQNHIPIDDLHALVEANVDKMERWQYPHNVHFRAEGSTALAAQVAKYIQAALLN